MPVLDFSMKTLYELEHSQFFGELILVVNIVEVMEEIFKRQDREKCKTFVYILTRKR